MPHRRRVIPDGNEGAPTSYSVREAAQQIKDKQGRPFSRRWLYKEIEAGRVETFLDDNGYMRISAEELARFKAKLSTESSGGSGKASPAENPAWRITRSKAGGFGKRARHSAEEISRPLQEGLRRSLENEVDPDHWLRDHNMTAELEQRVRALRHSQLASARAKSITSRR